MTDWAERARRLAWLRASPERPALLLAHYRNDPIALIDDWGTTYDPRLASTVVPFVLWPKQRDLLHWIMDRWSAGERGLVDKSRDVGATWCASALYVALAVTRPGLTLGLGSRDEDTVDRSDDPASIFHKLRFFIDNLPVELRGGNGPIGTRSHMRLSFPATGSTITGDAGKNIGRGSRTSIYIVDEAAHLQHPQAVEAALSATTNCRIDISSIMGADNPFNIRRRSGQVPRFTVHWRDDPRKDGEWYAKQQRELDAITVARELDLDETGASDRVLIPTQWITAAIDADKALGFEATGAWRAALDVADEGRDKCACAVSRGVKLVAVDEWSGVGGDIADTTRRAFGICDIRGARVLVYDSDGLGAGVRGDARLINATRSPTYRISAVPFRAGAAVAYPEQYVPTAAPGGAGAVVAGRKNKDYYANAKAQAAWSLRLRFERIWRARQAGNIDGYRVDDLIVIDGQMTGLTELVTELAQPAYDVNTSGKIIIDKAPGAAHSPNKYDAVMMLHAPLDRAGYDVDTLRRALG